MRKHLYTIIIIVSHLNKLIPSQVFAMLASLECLVPIIGSAVFTSLYNATSELSYPWVGSYYFASSGVVFLGDILT